MHERHRKAQLAARLRADEKWEEVLDSSGQVHGR
jgi:hypothetical protein